MKNPLFAYKNFVELYKTAAREEIEKHYPGHANAAFRDLLAFLRKHSSTISRWRVALIARLIQAEELARLLRKLLTEFPDEALQKTDTRSIGLMGFKRHMLSLLAHSLEANADAIADSGPPGTLRLRLN